MKAQIVVNFEGITPLELQYALQGLRNVEQENPERIHMFILVNAEELKAEDVTGILKKVTPPLEYIRVIDKSHGMASNRHIKEEDEGGLGHESKNN